jgi:hypothetical protein
VCKLGARHARAAKINGFPTDCNGNISVHCFLPSSHNSAFASPCPFFVLIWPRIFALKLREFRFRRRHRTRISVRLLEPERALTTLRLLAPFTCISLFRLLRAGSGSSIIRSPFMILSHSLARLKRIRSNLPPVGGGSPLYLIMKRLSFPHAVLALASLSCSFTVSFFSLIFLSCTQVSWLTGHRTALGLMRLLPTLPFPVRFLDLVRLEDMVHRWTRREPSCCQKNCCLIALTLLRISISGLAIHLHYHRQI